MKIILFMVLGILLTNQWISVDCSDNNNNTAIRLPPNKERFIEMVARRLRSLWVKYTAEERKDTFVGRCIGLAKQLKFVTPLIVFKLGVIVTILAFLTIFSLKSLGLLGLLVLMNVSGALSKVTLALAGSHHNSKVTKPPQTVHFHVHQDKDGHYYMDHTGSGWEDRLGKHESAEDWNKIESYNLYDKLSKNSLLRSYRATKR